MSPATFHDEVMRRVTSWPDGHDPAGGDVEELVMAYVWAADIVAGLPSDRQLSVVRRIATMGQTNPEIINEVERGLESRIAGVMSQSFENAGGVESVAEVLNVIDRATERTIVEALDQYLKIELPKF